MRRLPVVVLTTSVEESDVYGTYGLGVNSFIVKPVSLESLIEIMKILAKYWFHMVKLSR